MEPGIDQEVTVPGPVGWDHLTREEDVPGFLPLAGEGSDTEILKQAVTEDVTEDLLGLRDRVLPRGGPNPFPADRFLGQLATQLTGVVEDLDSQAIEGHDDLGVRCEDRVDDEPAGLRGGSGEEDLTSTAGVDGPVLEEEDPCLGEVVACLGKAHHQRRDQPNGGGRALDAGLFHQVLDPLLERNRLAIVKPQQTQDLRPVLAADYSVAGPCLGIRTGGGPQLELLWSESFRMQSHAGRVAEGVAQCRNALPFAHGLHHRLVEDVVGVVAGLLTAGGQHVEHSRRSPRSVNARQGVRDEAREDTGEQLIVERAGEERLTVVRELPRCVDNARESCPRGRGEVRPKGPHALWRPLDRGGPRDLNAFTRRRVSSVLHRGLGRMVSLRADHPDRSTVRIIEDQGIRLVVGQSDRAGGSGLAVLQPQLFDVLGEQNKLGRECREAPREHVPVALERRHHDSRRPLHEFDKNGVTPARVGRVHRACPAHHRVVSEPRYESTQHSLRLLPVENEGTGAAEHARAVCHREQGLKTEPKPADLLVPLDRVVSAHESDDPLDSEGLTGVGDVKSIGGQDDLTSS